MMTRIVWAALATVCLASAQSDWTAVGQLTAGQKIRILPLKGELISGRYLTWSADSLAIDRGGRRGTVTIARPEVRWVRAARKGGRLRRTLIGAAAGFGIGFVIGAALARQITDDNDPPRFETGGGMGLFGAGVGAGLAALAGGGTDYPVIYRTR
jgi:hypothetical protein